MSDFKYEFSSRIPVPGLETQDLGTEEEVSASEQVLFKPKPLVIPFPTGVGNGEWGVSNQESQLPILFLKGVGNKQWAVGERQILPSYSPLPTPVGRGMRNGEWAVGERQIPPVYSRLPTPDSLPSEESVTPNLPPLRWLRFARWFRFGIGIFLLLGILFTSVGCTSVASTPWQDATKVVNSHVLQSVVAADTSLDPQTAYKDVQAWVAKGRNGSLVMFDYHNTGVCGALGCLYSGYVLSKNTPPTRVFSAYFTSLLPRNRPLFAVADTNSSELPCLKANQLQNSQLRQLSYCYNGNSYQLAQSQLIDIKTSTEPKPKDVVKPTLLITKKKR